MKKICLVIAGVFWVLNLSGCGDGKGEPAAGNFGLSLVDVGEQALARGDKCLEQGDLPGAAEAYQQSIWAFNYHKKLTGVTPLMLDDALDGLRRLQREAPGVFSPKTVEEKR